METGRWHHAPSHTVTHPGIHLITAATYLRAPIFRSQTDLAYLHNKLLETFAEEGWELQAWAVFPNHYHALGFSPENSGDSKRVTRRLHSETAIAINRCQGQPNRKVWFNRWDSHLTYEKSYLARLSYVHRNAVHHGLVEQAADYPFCSARWFMEQADPAFRKMVLSLRTDRIKVIDIDN